MGDTLVLVFALIPFLVLIFFIARTYWRQEKKEKLKTVEQRRKDKALGSIKNTRGYGVTFVIVGLVILAKNSLVTTLVGMLFIAIGIYLAWSVHGKEKSVEVELQKEQV